jgi:hypothetical protein
LITLCVNGRAKIKEVLRITYHGKLCFYKTPTASETKKEIGDIYRLTDRYTDSEVISYDNFNFFRIRKAG